MQETRRLRLQSVILEEISRLVSREVKDPRVAQITFTSCDVTQDASQATLYIAVLGAMAIKNDIDGYDSPESRDKMAGCLKGLESASGFLRKQLGRILNVRHTPMLLFKEDKGLQNSTRVRELLQQLDNEKKPVSSSNTAGPTSTHGDEGSTA